MVIQKEICLTSGQVFILMNVHFKLKKEVLVKMLIKLGDNSY